MIEPARHFDFITSENDGHFLISEWAVPESLPYLDGHFPGQPILPAVAVVDACLEALRKVLKLDDTPRMSRLVSSKFMSPMTPGMKLEISFHESQPRTWKFDWREKARDGASARVLAQLLLAL